MLCIEFSGCLFCRQYVIRHLTASYQQRVDTYVQITFLFDGIFRGKCIEYELEVRNVFWCLFFQVDVEAE